MSQNKKNVIFVAKKLAHLKDKVVFIGGTAIELLLDIDYPLEPRISNDVDTIIEITGIINYAKFEKELIALNFKNNHDIICRWNIEDIIVDIIPTDKKILGFDNMWHKPLYQYAIKYNLLKNLNIKLATAPYLLATKIEAFKNRGNNDYYGSHDLEDVITLLDGRKSLLEEIQNSESKLKKYLKENFIKYFDNNSFKSALPGHLTPYKANTNSRINRINKIIDNFLKK